MNPNENLTRKNREVHKCNSCQRKFCFNSSLIKHKRIHTGEKPYLCNTEGCLRRFSQISNLIRHKRIHSGVKPYACKICSKSFSSSSNLKQHMEIHKTIIKRSKFICFIHDCAKSYLYICTLKKHIMFAHRKYFKELQEFYQDKNFFEIYKGLKKMKEEYCKNLPFVNFKDTNVDEITAENEKLNGNNSEERVDEQGKQIKQTKKIFTTIKMKPRMKFNDYCKGNLITTEINTLSQKGSNEILNNIPNNINSNNISNSNINSDKDNLQQQIEYEKLKLINLLINISNGNPIIKNYGKLDINNSMDTLNCMNMNQNINNSMFTSNLLNCLLNNYRNFNPMININNYLSMENPMGYFQNYNNYLNFLNYMNPGNGIENNYVNY